MEDRLASTTRPTKLEPHEGKLLKTDGERGRNRTFNPLIKRLRDRPKAAKTERDDLLSC